MKFTTEALYPSEIFTSRYRIPNLKQPPPQELTVLSISVSKFWNKKHPEALQKGRVPLTPQPYFLCMILAWVPGNGAPSAPYPLLGIGVEFFTPFDLQPMYYVKERMYEEYAQLDIQWM
ncbi:hypothetical protein BT96DRAFT_950084 [Gymnopus androsaceus JB14]|uniref:Uncharacterized protein n=1 Tax=Gymnopus androsaceus JB14 TaxID=1447944 RepID=A0A6A4GHY9_9AGAR|nr:hypothetical protein BT96DRAFT_950084 [Gymnopus androsaceus JB14]